MRVQITTSFCEIEHRNGYKVRSHMLFSDDISREAVDVGSVPDLIRELETRLEQAKAAHPGRSLFVHAIRDHRDKTRAFKGFNGRHWLLDYEAPKEAAAAELTA